MVGRNLSSVTLNHQSALTTNFLPVELIRPREANQLVNLPIGSLTKSALREQELLPVLPS
jgi:hypothetical protein